MAEKIHFAVRKTSRDTISIFGVKIPRIDNNWYIIPPELQDSTRHVKLRENPSGAGVMSVITKPREIKLNEEQALVGSYLDDNEIFCFNNIYLEMDHDDGILNLLLGDKQDKKTLSLEKRIAGIEKNQTKGKDHEIHYVLRDIEKFFNIELFYGEAHVENWMNQFEKECKRHRVFEDEDKIEALRLLTRKGAREWFTIMSKQGGELSWEKWKENFLEEFEKRNYESARLAVLYRYQSGPIMEYVYKKQRLLLDEAAKCDEEMMIILIVVGLPHHIQRSLCRKKIESIEDLRDKLSKFEPTSGKFQPSSTQNKSERKFDNRFQRNETATNQRNSTQKPNENRIECGFCASKGFPGRKHLETECHFKNRSKRQEGGKQMNLFEEEQHSQQNDDSIPLNEFAR